MSQMGKSEQSKLFESKMQQPGQNHRYIDKNIHETIERIQSYEIHQKKLIQIREDLEKKKMIKANGDTSYEHLKSQMTNNKLKSHEFTETVIIEKINEIKRSNQILLDKLLDISKGKRVRLYYNTLTDYQQCDVKQENITTTLPPGKSLNYQVKRREAERIDHENQKIMERIVNQNTSLSSKKMHQDYIQQLKYKKMKEQKMGLSIDKILEKKRRMVLEARSTILPLLNTKQNSPGSSENIGRNFNFGGGSIDAQSQRIINSTQVETGYNIAHSTLKQSNYQTQNQTTAVLNNRYVTKSQLTQNLNQSMSPNSQQQKRLLAKSELSEYKNQAKSIVQSNSQMKPNKIVLESITHKQQANNAKINSSLQLKQNKPPVPPQININSKTINKQQERINENQNFSKLSEMPPVKTSSLSKSFQDSKQKNLKMKPQNSQIPLNNFYSNQNHSKDKSKQNDTNQVNKKSVSLNKSLSIQQQDSTPKVAVTHGVNQADQIQKDIQNLDLDVKLKQELNHKDDKIQIDDDINSELEDEYEEKGNDNKINTSQKQDAIIKKQPTQSQVNQSYINDSKQYLERNSILSDTINNSNVKDKNDISGQNDKNDIDEYEEEFEEEIVE